MLNDRSKETNKSKQLIKQGFKRYKEKKERKEPATDSNSDIDNIIDDVTSSQEDFYEEMIQCENSISEITKMECDKENKENQN